tara:strand:+ start:1796 stop:2086 length:291 start_codon:yes stop_codon:yes gene_type:complete
MIYCFDVDGTICTQEDDYSNAQPLLDRIEQINLLYDEDHKIVFYTARGYLTGIDWSEKTKNQLEEWGVKYHSLVFGKPNADIYIDDKSSDPFSWFK